MPVSAVPAYDLMFQRHTDLSHLRLLAYRFMQRLQEAQSRNLELESLWQRPGVEEPVYSHLKYLVSTLNTENHSSPSAVTFSYKDNLFCRVTFFSLH